MFVRLTVVWCHSVHNSHFGGQSVGYCRLSGRDRHLSAISLHQSQADYDPIQASQFYEETPMSKLNDMVFDRFVGDIQASLQIVEELEHILEDMRTSGPSSAGQNSKSVSTQILSELQAA